MADWWRRSSVVPRRPFGNRYSSALVSDLPPICVPSGRAARRMRGFGSAHVVKVLGVSLEPRALSS